VTQSHELLESLFWTAVAAAHPAHCLAPALPEPPPRGRLILLAAGKGAGSLTEVAERHYLARISETRLEGVAVARHGYGRPTRRIAMVEAGHPIPDEAGLAGAERALALADGAGTDDLVLVPPIGSLRLRVSRLPKNKPRPAHSCAAAPILAKSTACESTSPASRAAVSPGALFLHAS